MNISHLYLAQKCTQVPREWRVDLRFFTYFDGSRFFTNVMELTFETASGVVERFDMMAATMGLIGGAQIASSCHILLHGMHYCWKEHALFFENKHENPSCVTCSFLRTSSHGQAFVTCKIAAILSSLYISTLSMYLLQAKR